MTLPVDPHLYAAFLGVMAVMAMTPGPANLFAIATGMARGKSALPAAVAGMNVATLVWFGAAALGLGALVAAFPQAFRLMAAAGAVYVAWLAIQSLLSAWKGPATPPDTADPRTEVHRSRNAFWDGFMVQIANPKAVLFFTGVLPPFLDPSRSMPPQLALFALGTIGMDVITMSTYGLGGAALAARLSRPAWKRGFDLVVGLMLLLASGLIVARLAG
jgi:threonine/homoserine/homoserine lactone efflux protein